MIWYPMGITWDFLKYGWFKALVFSSFQPLGVGCDLGILIHQFPWLQGWARPPKSTGSSACFTSQLDHLFGTKTSPK